MIKDRSAEWGGNMTEPSVLLASFDQYNSSILDQWHLNTVRSTGQHETSQIYNKQQSNHVLQNSQVPPFSMEQVILTHRSNCVNDLNLVLCNICQLKNEITDRLNKINGSINLLNDHINQLIYVFCYL